jgi:hypothetical protein
MMVLVLKKYTADLRLTTYKSEYMNGLGSSLKKSGLNSRDTIISSPI